MDQDLFENELELQSLREFKNSIYPHLEKELTMWRCMYLDSIFPARYKEKEAQVRRYFSKASSEHMSKNGPEACLQDIEKIFNKGAP